MRLLKVIILTFFTLLSPLATLKAQEQTKPTVVYGQEQKYEIGGIAVEGVQNYEDYILIGLSGLTVGEVISVPGDEITEAVKRYWKHGLFSAVKIEADSIVDEKVYLKITLATRPRVAQININGVKKSEHDDLQEKMGIVKGNQLTPNMVDKAKIVIKKYFDEKGFKNAEVNIVQRDDSVHAGQLVVDVNIDKKEKVKINRVFITGNNNIPTKKFQGGLFQAGLMKKTHGRGFGNFMMSRKFTESKYNESKDNIIDKYNELGFRDAYIYADSVVAIGDNEVNLFLHIDEGDKYYVRDIHWVGNTIYSTDILNQVLQMNRGDVYNKKHIREQLHEDDQSVSNMYYNEGYVFNQVNDVEMNVDGDSIDLEIRIYEGQQATINKIKIFGNTRVYEEVVRRELLMKPGDLFSMDAFKMTYQSIAQMGHFDPEAMNPNEWIKPDQINGTVDLNIGLTPKASDQIEFSLGWGQMGIIGKVGLKFTNFSVRNLIGKNRNHRGIIPQGDAQELEISASTNGTYYQQYSISFVDPWFGRKRPNQLSVSAFFSRQTDISSNYYNSAYYNNYYSMLYGAGNYNSSYYNNYSSYYDPDKYIEMVGVSVGFGKRLTWPDNRFSFMAQLGYTRYMMKDWEYFIIQNGNCNDINLTLSLSRSSIGNPMFPRSGSEISGSVAFTPPYSLFDGVDYKGMAGDRDYTNASYQKDMSRKHRWIEYHKWKFHSRLYTPLGRGQKCFVLMSRFDFAILGNYSKYKKSPFGTFYVGGDGMSGYSSSYYSETIGLRGYDNGALTQGYNYGYAYDRMTLELRYPLMLNGSTNIYALAFAEGGNAWTEIKKFNPFDMKRSAGVGVRIFLPMVGLMGIDWAYGFDNINGSKSYSGSQFHFVLGQEF
ncbi:MAG: outer membrane protein assembly factor BamA [Bacteroidaceae bacterium]|nr:outer membrane protein assembly factor BamA [Bacteroidaceae bacterium]MBQ6750262.1 outer membrane protein assembly factor BamA [Bacteroidaceae bacterium]